VDFHQKSTIQTIQKQLFLSLSFKNRTIAFGQTGCLFSIVSHVKS
jgi:hypothetical protein